MALYFSSHGENALMRGEYNSIQGAKLAGLPAVVVPSIGSDMVPDQARTRTAHIARNAKIPPDSSPPAVVVPSDALAPAADLPFCATCPGLRAEISVARANLGRAVSLVSAERRRAEEAEARLRALKTRATMMMGGTDTASAIAAQAGLGLGAGRLFSGSLGAYDLSGISAAEALRSLGRRQALLSMDLAVGAGLQSGGFTGTPSASSVGGFNATASFAAASPALGLPRAGVADATSKLMAKTLSPHAFAVPPGSAPTAALLEATARMTATPSAAVAGMAPPRSMAAIVSTAASPVTTSQELLSPDAATSQPRFSLGAQNNEVIGSSNTKLEIKNSNSDTTLKDTAPKPKTDVGVHDLSADKTAEKPKKTQIEVLSGQKRKAIQDPDALSGLVPSSNGSVPSAEKGSTTAASSASPRGANKKSSHSRGDPRMNRAVAAKLAEPSTSLLDALVVHGGFVFPGHPDGGGVTETKKRSGGGAVVPGVNDKSIVDGEGVSLYQRKNQLNRRLRRAKADRQALGCSVVAGGVEKKARAGGNCGPVGAIALGTH